MANILSQLLEELNSGRLKIVDLTTPLGPDTPVIDLPPIFAPSPGLTLTEISHYDSRGPAWYWNMMNLGEHTGTHFDAPIHWGTGKDLPNNATDTIPPSKLIGQRCAVRAAISKPYIYARRRQIRYYQAGEPGVAAGNWRNCDCRAAQDRQWFR